MNKIQKITACVLLHKDGKIFVAKRAKTKKLFPGLFEIPGGHIEFGETLEEGLKRELKEELGIDIVLGELVYAFTYISEDNTSHSVEIDYLATMKDPNQKIKLIPKDHTEYKWVTYNEAQDLIKNNPKVLEAINKAFKLLGKLK